MRSLPFSAALWIAIAAPAFAQTISESPNPAAPNAALSVPFTDPGAQINDNIWIQDGNGNHLQVLYLNGLSTPPSAPITSGTITTFTAPATPGNYNIYGGFHGTAVGPVAFTVSASATPTPTGITYSPSYGVVVDTSAANAVVGGFVVAMSDGSTFNGTDTLLTGSDALCAAPASGNGNLILSRAVTKADVGAHTCKLQATENGSSKEVDFTFNVDPAVQFSDGTYILPGLQNGYALGLNGGAWAMFQAGSAANTIWNGAGAPAASLGANGDFYIDTAAHAIYGPKASGAWPSSGVPLVGPQGATGATGAQGPAGQNAGQNTYPACPAPTDTATVGNSMFCSANGHTDIAVSPAANTWVYFGPAAATAP